MLVDKSKGLRSCRVAQSLIVGTSGSAQDHTRHTRICVAESGIIGAFGNIHRSNAALLLEELTLAKQVNSMSAAAAGTACRNKQDRSNSLLGNAVLRDRFLLWPYDPCNCRNKRSVLNGINSLKAIGSAVTGHECSKDPNKAIGNSHESLLPWPQLALHGC